MVGPVTFTTSQKVCSSPDHHLTHSAFPFFLFLVSPAYSHTRSPPGIRWFISGTGEACGPTSAVSGGGLSISGTDSGAACGSLSATPSGGSSISRGGGVRVTGLRLSSPVGGGGVLHTEFPRHLHLDLSTCSADLLHPLSHYPIHLISGFSCTCCLVVSLSAC